MSDSKHERDGRAEAVQALMLIREQCADVDAWQVWAANGDLVEAYPDELLDHITALTQRAEAAEAATTRAMRGIEVALNEHEACKVLLFRIEELKAEREALRTVDDAMVERAVEAYFLKRGGYDSATVAMRHALDAALAVQPTTGDTHE